MRKVFESFEGELDDEVVEKARGICSRLRSSISALGDFPDEDKVVAAIERFVRSFVALDAKYDFMTSAEADDVRSWFEEFAVAKELGVGSLDDLEDVSLPI